MKKMNKLVALLLAAVMVLGMMPTMSAHANEYHTHSVEEYPTIALDTPTLVEVSEGGYIAYFAFTPEVTDQYHFYSSTDFDYCDPYATLYDAEMNLLATSDDAYYGNAMGVSSPNFCIDWVMEADVTYVLAARLYSSGATGSFNVKLTQGHSYTSAVTKEHTCTEDGVLTYTCTYCGNSYDEPIPAAHTWGEDGNCTVCGETYLITGVCGDDLTWTLDWFGKLTISGTGDMYDFFYSWEENTPSEWYTDDNSDIKSVVIEEGCTSIGEYAFYQANGMSEVSIPASVTEIGAHAFDNTALTAIEVPETVTTVGEGAFASNYNLVSAKLPSGLTSIPASCFEYCGALNEVVWPDAATSVGDKAFYNCNLGDLVVPEGITYIGASAFGGNSDMTMLTLPTTLTELADRAFSSCWGVLDFVFTGNAPVMPEATFYWVTANVWYPAGNDSWTEEVMQQYGGTLTWKAMCAEHAFGEWTTIEATCETGAYETRTCSVCGWTENTEQGEPLGHDYVYTVVEPNCATNEYGRTEITCTRCAYYSSENWVYPEHQYEATVHEPTCEEDGYTNYICTACGSYYTTDIIPALGHTVEEWSEPSEPTCTEPGVKTGLCTTCGETAVEEVTPALGHTWDEENAVENDDGSMTYTCTVCGETYRTEGTVLFLGDNEFTVEGNSGGKSKTFTAEENGNLTITINNVVYHNSYAWDNGYTDEYWQTLGISWCFSQGFFTVSINGENIGYTANGDHEVILNAVDVNAGDVVTVAVNHLEASYYDGDDVKFNMNLSLVPAHTHNYIAEVTEPTCTEYGFTTYTCECGDSYIDEDSWTEPEHKWDDGVVTEPTCTEGGYTTFTCTACGESYVDEDSYTDALGHTFGDWSVITEPTCTEDGMMSRSCHCGETETTAMEALGHDFINGECSRCDAEKEATFEDVPVGSFYFDPVEWAVEQGITTGATETTSIPTVICSVPLSS